MASEWRDVKPFIMNPYRDAENHGWDEWDEADLSRSADTRLCRALDGTYGPCEPAMYVRAARAWQAFRDWLDGVALEWQIHAEQEFAEGENVGFGRGMEAGMLMIQGRCVAWQMVINFLNGTPEQWQRRMVMHGRASFAEGATINPLMAEMYQRIGGQQR